jgi:hypothetical protein
MIMRRLVVAALLALALTAAGGQAFAATFHAIIFANTEDEGIGCIYDVVNIGAFLRDAQKETGMALKAKVFLTVSATNPEKLASIKKWAEVVDGWSKTILDKEFKALAPGKDDIVFFYYSGHGGRMSSKKGRWPDMALQSDQLVDLAYPMDLLAKKPVQPRLAISLGDCCNSYMDRSVAPATRSAKDSSGLKNLFLNYTGVVVASGSEPGQYSLGGSDGGVFTNCYIKSTYNPTNADWDGVLKAAQVMAARNTDGSQKPQYDLKGLHVVGAGGAAVAVATTAPAAASAAVPAAAPASEVAPGWGASHAGGAAAAQQASLDSGPDESDAEVATAIPIVKGKASGSRKTGNSPYPFSELATASLADEDGDLVATFGLKGMQKTFVFNSPDVPANELEYDWSANIDVDGDGEDDYSLSLTHFKAEGGKRQELSLAKGCQANLWKLDGSGGEVTDVEVDARIEKNSLVLTAYGYQDAFELEKGSTVNFMAVYYLGGESYIP